MLADMDRILKLAVVRTLFAYILLGYSYQIAEFVPFILYMSPAVCYCSLGGGGGILQFNHRFS